MRRAANAAAARREPKSGARGATLCTAARPTLPLPSATLSSVVLAAQLISHGQRRRHETHQEGAPGPREGPPIHLQRRPTRRRSLPLAVYDHGTGARVCRCGRPPPLPFRPFPTSTRPPHGTPPSSAASTTAFAPFPLRAPSPLHLPRPRTCTIALAPALTRLPLFALVFTHTPRALPRRKTRRTREASSS